MANSVWAQALNNVLEYNKNIVSIFELGQKKKVQAAKTLTHVLLTLPDQSSLP